MLLKYLIILLSAISFGKFANNNFFNINNSRLKILKIDDDNLLFYGTNGGILRTDDACNTWKQTFSGTHNSISNMIFNKNIIYGLTFGNELLVSNNLGDTWKISSLGIENESFSDFAIKNDILYLSSYEGNIYTYNLESNEIRKITTSPLDSIINIEIVYDNIIVQLNKGNIYYSKFDQALNWNSLQNDDDLIMTNKNNILYFYSQRKLSILNSNFELDYFDISYDSTDRHINFIPYKNEIILLDLNPNNQIAKISSYDKSSHTIEVLYSEPINYFLPEDYFNVDINIINEELLFTTIGKTILKTKDSFNSVELLSYLPITASSFISNKFYSSQYFVIPTSNSSLVFSSNGGKTFQPTSTFFIDTINNIPQRAYAESIFILDSMDAILTTTKKIKESNIYFTSDGFHTMDQLNDIPAPLKYINRIDNYLYSFYVRDDNNNLMLSKLNLSNNKVSNQINLGEILYNGANFINTGSDLIILLERDVENENNMILYKYNYQQEKVLDSITYQLKETDKLSTIINLSNGFVFSVRDIFTRERINYFIDYNFTERELITTNIELDSIISPIGNSAYLKNNIENDTVVTAKNLNGANEFYLSKLTFDYNNYKLNLDSIAYLGHHLRFENTIDDKSRILTFNTKDIWIPIEQDSLKTNVEARVEAPPVLWLYPPRPNPVNNVTRLRFYSAKINKIHELEAQLISIGSGRLYDIDNFEFIPESGYFGFLEFELGEFNPGAYILNLKLGTESKSELIIIE